MKNLLKIVCFSLTVAMMFSFASCGKKTASKKATTTATTTTTAPPVYYNPLTGESGFDSKLVGKKPVAVMVNNIQVAQSVQCGIDSADIVYETLAEGGITRLMAVFSDISKVERVGSVRSARISYAQLAAGLDAFYVHCGADNRYCSSSYRSSLGIDSMDLGNNASSCGKRIANGLAWEHTLFAMTDKIQSYIKDKDNKVKDSSKDPFVFNDEKSDVTYTKSLANTLSVKFSDYYTSYFRYDAKTKKYSRGNSNGDLKDAVSEKSEAFKNVIVIYTSVHALGDGYHMKSELNSGKGMYFTNGTYTNIKWEKKSETSPLKYYNEDGSDLKLNVGSSYVCITNDSTATITK